MAKVNRVLVTFPATAAHREALQANAPGVSFAYIPMKNLRVEDVREVDVSLGGIPADLLPEAKVLKWIQLHSAGVDGYYTSLPEKIQLSCATGIYGPTVAEHAFAMMLALQKNLPLYRDEQNRRVWKDHGPALDLCGNTVLIIGLGDIGATFAQLVRPFQSHIIGIVRNPRQDALADELYTSLDSLDTLLPKADVVFICLPETSATHHVMNARRLSLMKPTGIVLNVGRGNAIDTESLCDAAESGSIRGAGLDVTDPEPLPSDHRLWRIPSILLTPHVSGGFHLPQTMERLVRLCSENLARYQEGAPLKSQVDRVHGYAYHGADGQE